MKIKHRQVLLIVILLAILALACGLTIPREAITENIPTVAIRPTAQPTPVTISLPNVITDEDLVLIELYRKVNPAVVSINLYIHQGGDVSPEGQGSGFVFDETGDIVTNAHVVQDADEFEVIFWDGAIRSALVVGIDFHSDLAVVRVNQLPEGVQPLPLGNMNDVQVGQTVVAIGNPFGLEGTLTRGIVSAMGRSIPALTPFYIPQSIQTDAAINPGNSGGPLLNLKGEVIGVNAQIETSGGNQSNSGVGFAIPVSIVQRVVPALIQEGRYQWPWLGVSGGSLSPVMVEAMNLSVQDGAYISEVLSDGPSIKAGLRGSSDTVSVGGRVVEIGGDIITAIDGVPVHNFTDILIYIALQTTPGQEVTLTVLRDGQPRDIIVKLEPRPDTQEVFP